MAVSKRKRFCARFFAVVILCCIMISEMAASIPAFAAELSGLSLSLNQYTSDLVIYNYLCYTSGTGALQTGSGTNYYTLKGTSDVNILVGDQGETVGDTRPMDKDIQIKFEGLDMSSRKKMTVSPVYGGKRVVRAEVSTASTINTLVVRAGAKMIITLKAELTVSSLILEEGSSLEVLTNSNTLNIDSASGTGNLTLSGNGALDCENVSVGNITLNNVTVDGNGSGTLTAKGTIAVNGATVQNMSLFGYDNTVMGNKTISFNVGYLKNVAVVGAGNNTGAFVTLKGIDTISSSFDTNYVYDYSITYMAGDTALTPQSGWPTAYRVEHNALTNATTRVLGYISESVFNPCSTVVLPSYGTAFFGYEGWELDGEKITELTSSQTGEVVLAAVLEPGTVTVDMTLGYVPSETTNDEPLPPTSYTTTSSVGSVIELSSPVRFGYVFKGWRIVSGTQNGIYYDTYTISEDDLDTVAGSDTFALIMEAVWEIDKFPIRLTIGTALEIEDIEISVDGGTSWKGFGTFINSLPASVTYNNRVLSSSDYIVYGESLDEYFTRIFGAYPILRDKTNVYTFAAWYNSSNGTVTSKGGVYRYGEGILIRPEGTAFTDWQTELKEAPISLAPLWVETTYEYTLHINDLSGWTVLVNGSTKTLDANNEIKVQLGSRVTLKRPNNSNLSLSHWSITNVSTVTERTYSAGDAYLYYDFDMPASDVELTSRKRNDTSDGNDQLYLDLSKSPIRFDENVSYNGRLHKGFWLNEKTNSMIPLFYESGKGYFYIWDDTEPFHVTTNGVPTQNQLTLVNAMPGGVYIKNCNLVATDEYLSGAVGRYLGGKLMEAGKAGAPSSVVQGTDWSAYGNIILNNLTHPSYTTNLYMRGTNTVASIIMSNAYTSSAYAGTLNIIGEGKASSFLTLGSVVFFGKLYVKKLTITEYDDNFEYLLYTLTAQMNCDNLDISDCKVDAHAKRIYNSFNYFDVRNTNLDIGSIFVAYSLRMYGSSYARVRGDVVAYYYLIEINGTSSLVVDGGIYTMNQTVSYGNGSISTSGYVLVKGMGIVTTGLKVSGNAVVIANLITASRGSSYSNGVIVTNMITNPLTLAPSLSGDKYVIRAYTSSSVSCTDKYPFYSYSNKQQTTSTLDFCGSRVYLFGYYKGGTGSYDITNNLNDDVNNPVKSIIDSLLDANGDLIDLYKTTSNRTQVSANAAMKLEELIEEGILVNNECILVGDSAHTSSSIYSKSVVVREGALCAVGNVNFFNSTTVSGGSVLCGGRFGSKRDLTVSGGNVVATEVGISYNCTVTENGMERYSKLTLSGGKVITDRLGAHSVALGGSVTARGIIERSIASTLEPYTSTDIAVHSSLRANYFYDSNAFILSAGNPASLDFVGVYKNGALSAFTMKNDVTLISPALKNSSDSAMWIYDDSNGEQITSVSGAGMVNGDESLGCVYVDRESFALYAAKGSYNLTVNGDYQNNGFEVIYNGNYYEQNTAFSVNAGALVTVKLDNAIILDNTIILYVDAAGLLHNVCKLDGSTVDRNMNTITFRMPYADTEIWITSEFTLYLDQYSISFMDNGFALEEASPNRRNDCIFEYAGDIRIAQKTSSSTYNRILFETATSGNVTTNRKITLYQLRQNSLGTLYGIVLADGAQVVFIIDHGNGSKTVLAPVEVTRNSSVSFIGAKGDASKNTLSFRSFLSLNSFICVGGSVAGTITYQDLTLVTESGGYAQFARSLNKSSNSVSFIRCKYSASNYYTYDTLAYNMGAVYMYGCEMTILGSKDLSNTIVSSCSSLTIENSSIKYATGGTRGGKHPFMGVSEAVTVNNSTIDIIYNRLASASATNLENTGLYGKMVLLGNTVVNIDNRIAFRSLTMSGNAVLNISNGEGYLLCPEISLSENATINVGYVIVSGFVVGEYEDKQAVLKALAGSGVINGASYSGLSVKGGTLNAKYFVGGDRNAKLNISGGTVNTAALGTYGAYFGYGKYIPNLMESEFVYLYVKIPAKGTVINISGGTVNVTANGYIGGMYADVNITGGYVQLNDGVILGMTDDQTTTVYNNASAQGKIEELVDVVTVTVSNGRIEGSSISVPYGKITVSGKETAINVEFLSADCGTVLINDTESNYSNPYTGTKDHVQVGVIVSERLEALNLYIGNGAIVYAETAYAYARTAVPGILMVSGNAHLYTGREYGSRGEGDSSVSENGGTIHGKKRYYIHYVLGGDVMDPAYNDGRNPAYYIFGGEDVTLYEPSRSGYDFAGWYMDEEFSGEPFDTIAASVGLNRVIYAKWTPKKATFIIKIETAVFGNSFTVSDLIEETLNYGVSGTISGNTFTFEQTVEVEYLGDILGVGEGHIDLDDFAIRSYKIVELVFADTMEVLLPGTRVTKDMLGEEPVVLKVSVANNTRTRVTLNINLSGGLPLDFKFNYNSSPDIVYFDYVQSYIDIGKSLDFANGFAFGGSLISPTAPGYDFGGWYTSPDCSGEVVSADYIITVDSTTVFYAKWINREYYIVFDSGINDELSESNKITLDTEQPQLSGGDRKLIALIAYDRPLSSAKYYYSVTVDGIYEEWVEIEDISKLPVAWAEGYTYRNSWYYTDVNGSKKEISLSTVFNLTNIRVTDWTNDIAAVDGAGVPITAVIFEPFLERTKIVYDTNGGTIVGIDDPNAEWKQNYGSIEKVSGKTGVYTMQTAVYKAPLLGYSASVAASSDYAFTNTTTCVHGIQYSVVSTNAEYYASNGYTSNDYRLEIGNKGYTFLGWRIMTEGVGGKLVPKTDSEGNDIYLGYFSRYEDITVQAVWKANTYDIVLKPYDSEMNYYSKFNEVSDINIGSLTVGEEIKGIANWPTRDKGSEWFAYNPGIVGEITDDQKRYLLGFTFDPLDPGDTTPQSPGYVIYGNYSVYITTLLIDDYEDDDSDDIYVYSHRAKSTPGTIFRLPGDSEYNGDKITGTHKVPDYPEGSSIDMYAVYRERSLVFMEYYKDGSGNTTKRFLASYPWDKWSDYPIDPNGYAIHKNSDVLNERNGYYLFAWLINGTTIGSDDTYPGSLGELTEAEASALYESKVSAYKEDAENLGTYDIIVYTAYVARDEQSGTLNLTASTDPRAPYSTVAQYTLPGSMQEGTMTYTVELNGLTFVKSDAELANILYNSNESNSKVALKAILYDENGVQRGSQWLRSDVTDEDLFGVSATGGWKITLQLYHSSVVTELNNYEFKLTIGFKSDVAPGEKDPLENQKVIFSNSRISMLPSIYTVEYTAEFPADPKVKDWNGFDSNSKYVNASMQYGGALLSNVPVIEGYNTVNSRWESNTEGISFAYGDALCGVTTADLLARDAVERGDAVIKLSTSWEINMHRLTGTDELLARWNIMYGNELLGGTPVNIPYRTEITVFSKSSSEYPEFVQLTLSSGDRVSLDGYASYSSVDGVYRFTMPDEDIDAFFTRLITLYLEGGSIGIDPNGYTQNGENSVWRGDYTILMDAYNNTDNSETANTITFTGDLSDRALSLGDLKISSEDSVALSNNTAATLILYAEGKASTVQGFNIAVPYTATLTVEGREGRISLAPAKDVAAIGGKNSESGIIVLEDLDIYMHMTPSYASGIGPGNRTSGGKNITLTNCNVTVRQNAHSDAYRGVWIGGSGVSEVTLIDTTVLLDQNSDNMLDPKVLDADKVSLDGCQIGTSSVPMVNIIHAKDLLSIKDTKIYQSLTSGIPFGTDDGITEVYNSFILSDITYYSELYSGQLLIYDADSDIVVAGTQILEAKYGDIAITDTQVTQGGVSHSHNKSYLIINGFADGSCPDLSVVSISPAANVTLRDLDIGTLTASADVTVIIDGDVAFTEVITVANEKTLTTEAKDGSTLTVEKGFDITTYGNYSHTGGTLIGNADISVGGSLTLINTSVVATGKRVGSLGLGGNVTTVTVSGSSITADRIGALGVYNETFTFVVESNGATFSGTVVRDLFRLDYVIDSSYDISALGRVLRSETSGGVTVYTPAVPASPSPANNFLFWYILDGAGQIIALGSISDPSIASVDGLNATHIEYANAEELDGTRTLLIYAFMNLTVSGVIESGKLLNQSDFTSDGASVLIYGYGKWTAKFNVYGSALSNSSYVLDIQTPFPTGSMLTLGVMHLNVPIFYYYICDGSETAIALSSFIRMGSENEAPRLLEVDTGTELSDVLIISADFSKAYGNAEISNTLTLKVLSSALQIADCSLEYSTTREAFVTVTDEATTVDTTVNISFAGDSQYSVKQLYLVAMIRSNTQIPYNAKLTVGGSPAIAIDRNTWAISLGSAADSTDVSESFEFEGLDSGYYTVVFSLTVAEPKTQNVLGNEIATSQPFDFEIEEDKEIILTLDRITIDGSAPESYVLDGGKEHTVVMAITYNRDVTAVLEKQNDNGGFDVVEIEGIVMNETGYSITLPADLIAGIYRITLSADPDISGDDVHVPFMITEG